LKDKQLGKEITMKLKEVLPMDIEKRSMEIIGEELGEVQLDPDKASIVKRVIHTSADFDYARNLRFSDGVVGKALAVLQQGVPPL
jgi:precorrin-8X/cobalt-precorrin-8 methylmutase